MPQKAFLPRRNDATKANRTKTALACQKEAFGPVFRPRRVRWLLQDLRSGRHTRRRSRIDEITDNLLLAFPTPPESSPQPAERSPPRSERSAERGERFPPLPETSPEPGERSAKPAERSPERSERSPERSERSPGRGERSPKGSERSPEPGGRLILLSGYKSRCMRWLYCFDSVGKPSGKTMNPKRWGGGFPPFVDGLRPADKVKPPAAATTPTWPYMGNGG